MIEALAKSPLFAGMAEDDIESCLRCSRSEVADYEKEELVFRRSDAPEKLLVLLSGAVAVCDDSSTGKRSIVAAFDRPGELFGEVYLFLNKGSYDHYAEATAPSRVLRIPQDFLTHTCGRNCGYHARLISNMLSILAQKAYFLNRRLQVVSCATLRQKIAALFLQNRAEGERVALSMNREELADFLNTARPSLSRELMRMRDDGLIKIDKKGISVPDPQKLQNLL